MRASKLIEILAREIAMHGDCIVVGRQAGQQEVKSIFEVTVLTKRGEKLILINTGVRYEI